MTECSVWSRFFTSLNFIIYIRNIFVSNNAVYLIIVETMLTSFLGVRQNLSSEFVLEI